MTVRYSRLLFVGLLPCLFLADILHGLLQSEGYSGSLSPGELIRGPVLLWAAWTFVHDGHLLERSLRRLMWAILITGMAGPAYAFVLGPSFDDLARDLGSLAKILYGPLLCVVFYLALLRWPQSTGALIRSVAYVAFLVGPALLFMRAAGLGSDTYGDYAFGFKGLFDAQNDIGLALGIASAAALFVLFRRPNTPTAVLTVTALLGLASLGTRAALLLTVFTPVCMMLVFMWSAGEHGRAQRVVTIVTIIAVLAAAAVAGVQAYRAASQNAFELARMESLADLDLPRIMLIKAGLAQVSVRSRVADITGEGSSRFKRGVYKHWGVVVTNSGDMRAVEVDWLDLYGAHGLVFTALLHGLYLGALLRSVRAFVARRSRVHGLIALALGLFLGHSALAGHAMVSPMPSPVVGALMAVGLLDRRLARTTAVPRIAPEPSGPAAATAT